jgi:hypothetical protein
MPFRACRSDDFITGATKFESERSFHHSSVLKKAGLKEGDWCLWIREPGLSPDFLYPAHVRSFSDTGLIRLG